ncbi:hypothetical protein N8751_01400 [bacterium]|jgi:hypothetical protein|nr:hypothetical protein [bacterium]
MTQSTQQINELKLQCRKLWAKNKGLKWKYSFYSALIFFVISSPQAYVLSQKLVGNLFALSGDGCPTSLGLFIHTLVFMVALYGIMNLPKD